MANKLNVQGTEVSVISIHEEDYICLTDMMKIKEGDFFFHNWLRNRNTVEFLGIWEKVHNPNFNSVEFDIIKSQAGLHSFPKKIVIEGQIYIHRGEKTYTLTGQEVK